MTVRELMDLLASEDPAAEVRLMSQPSYPMDNGVAGVWTPPAPVQALCLECGQDGDSPLHEDDGSSPYHHEFAEAESTDSFRPMDDFRTPHDGPVVYITEGSQNGYGDRGAWS